LDAPTLGGQDWAELRRVMFSACSQHNGFMSEMIFLTGAKHPAFSTNHLTDMDKTKQNYISKAKQTCKKTTNTGPTQNPKQMPGSSQKLLIIKFCLMHEMQPLRRPAIHRKNCAYYT